MFARGAVTQRERDAELTARRQERQEVNSVSCATDIAFAVTFDRKIHADDAQELVEVLERMPGIFKVRYSEPSSFVCWYADEPSVLDETSEECSAEACEASPAKTRKTELHAYVQAALSTFLDNHEIHPDDWQDWKPSIYGLA